eukprot:5251480-Alexandrium_andersonii.AAC.1
MPALAVAAWLPATTAASITAGRKPERWTRGAMKTHARTLTHAHFAHTRNTQHRMLPHRRAPPAQATLRFSPGVPTKE